MTIGSDGLGLISYMKLFGDASLKVAHCQNLACSTADITTLDTLGGDAFGTSITIGTDGMGLISYQNLTQGSQLAVAHCSNLPCSDATTVAVDSSGSFNSIAIGADGLGLIGYHAQGALKVAHCSNVFCAPYFRRR